MVNPTKSRKIPTRKNKITAPPDEQVAAVLNNAMLLCFTSKFGERLDDEFGDGSRIWFVVLFEHVVFGSKYAPVTAPRAVQVRVHTNGVSVQFSFGSPHVCPMWAFSMCGEPSEIEKDTHPENITAFFFSMWAGT